MVGLPASPQEYVDKGFTPEKQAAAFKRIAHDHGMPIDTSPRPRMSGDDPGLPRGDRRAPARARARAHAAAAPARPPLLR